MEPMDPKKHPLMLLTSFLGRIAGLLDGEVFEIMLGLAKESEFPIAVVEKTHKNLTRFLIALQAEKESATPLEGFVSLEEIKEGTDPVASGILSEILVHQEKYGFVLGLFEKETGTTQHFSNGSIETQIDLLNQMLVHLKGVKQTPSMKH